MPQRPTLAGVAGEFEHDLRPAAPQGRLERLRWTAGGHSDALNPAFHTAESETEPS